MPSPELVEFIKKGLASGHQPHSLQLQALQHKDWTQDDINTAISEAMLSVQPNTAATTSQGGHFFKRHKVLVAVLVLTGFIIGGGLYATTYYMPPSVGEVRALVFDRLQELHTAEYSGTLEGELTTDAVISVNNFLKYGPQKVYPADYNIAGSKNTKVRLDFTGKTDTTDRTRPKSDFSFTLTAEGFVVGVETITISQDIFFKVTQMPEVGFDFSTYLNQWFKLDYQKLNEVTGKSASEDITIEQRNRIRDIVIDSNIYQIAERLDNERINGIDTYHYRYTIDEVALLAALERIAHVLVGSDEFSIPVTERKEILDWIDIKGGEIWLAKKDLSPTKMTFEMAMHSVNDAPVTGRLTLVINFKNYNQDVKITPPESYKDIMNVLSEEFNKTSVITRDAMRIAHIKQLQTAFELYYNGFGRYPNTMEQLTTTETSLLTSLPQAPTPNDGTCTEEENQYKYTPSSNRSNYELIFCLGGEQGGYSAGVRTASPAGIK